MRNGRSCRYIHQAVGPDGGRQHAGALVGKQLHAARRIAARAQELAALRDELIARGEPYAGALARGKAVRMALDQVMSDEQAVLREGCEVAFFPPVTGG